PCTGGTLPIMQNQPLAAVIGTNFGGDGMMDIGVPDLHARVAIGGAPVGGMRPGALVLTWLIATNAGSAAPMPGAVM
ncbi:tail fiber protein, partial [Escherichia coli]|nr:tail fiber protein [Escherichia coli]